MIDVIDGRSRGRRGVGSSHRCGSQECQQESQQVGQERSYVSDDFMCDHSQVWLQGQRIGMADRSGSGRQCGENGGAIGSHRRFVLNDIGIGDSRK